MKHNRQFDGCIWRDYTFRSIPFCEYVFPFQYDTLVV